jgi:hypothetical protein
MVDLSGMFVIVSAYDVADRLPTAFVGYPAQNASAAMGRRRALAHNQEHRVRKRTLAGAQIFTIQTQRILVVLSILCHHRATLGDKIGSSPAQNRPRPNS